MIVCAGNNETFDFAMPIGVGLIESAINLTRLAMFDKPNFLVFVGSAGSYGSYKPFDIVESSIASNLEISFLENKSYTPIDNVIEAYKDNVSHETLGQNKKIIVNSSNYITIDSEIAKSYLKYNIELENMEFFSVLKIGQEFEIPVHGIFVITNYCNQNAHQDFVNNHSKAKQLLKTYVIDKYKKILQ